MAGLRRVRAGLGERAARSSPRSRGRGLSDWAPPPKAADLARLSVCANRRRRLRGRRLRVKLSLRAGG